jgi:RNA polymerase sigma-70 factor (sigma-E family)
MLAERVRSVAERDTLDVPALYAAHWRSMVRLAVLLVDDVPTAEDVVQDAFISLYRNQGRLRAPEAALGYVRQSVVNGARSTLRHRSVVRRTLHVVADDPSGAERETFEAVGVDSEMIAALRTLPRRMQEVLVLRYWSDLSEAEIAETLGISAGSVKSTASRGVERLRSTLGGAR